MQSTQHDQTAVVDGVVVRYRLDGPATAPVLMFGNGLATDISMWDEQAAHFAEHFRVLRYDTRGHGGSETSPPPYSIEQLAEDAVGLLDRLGVERVHYVGLSLGGMIGQSLAARHPDRIASLALCATTLRSSRGMWDERIAAIEADGIEPQVESSILRWFSPSFSAERPAFIEDMRRMIRSTSKPGYLGCAMAIRDMNLRETAPLITVPTVIVVGSDDRSTPIAEANLLNAAIAQSTLVIIDHAAHLPNIEQEAQFNTALEAFLAGHGA